MIQQLAGCRLSVFVAEVIRYLAKRVKLNGRDHIASIGYRIRPTEEITVYFLADAKPSMLDHNKLYCKMFYSTGPMNNKK
jgi:hypothetical protein